MSIRNFRYLSDLNLDIYLDSRYPCLEDYDTVRGLIWVMLENAGHEVLEASDGEEGVRLYRQKYPDLVITDVPLPKKDGPEMMQELRNAFPDIKFIVITIHVLPILAKALQLGARYAFTKPFRIQKFLSAVEEILAEYSSSVPVYPTTTVTA